MMKITNNKKEGNILRFDISGVDVKMLNAFRRTIMSWVPVMAVEKVNFKFNSSILNDENLAHRIGLVPLTTKFGKYALPQDCECEGQGCPKCSCKLTIDVHGPATVYSADLKSGDSDVKPVYDTIPLVKLMDKQSITLEAEAIAGAGSEHMKWQPALCSYELKDKDTYSVLVESFGQVPVEELVKAAFEVVSEKIKQIKIK